MPGYFIELDLSGRLVIVVGLGAVGSRRASALIASGARVIGIDPAAADPSFQAPEGVEIRPERYRAFHLEPPEGRPTLVLASASTEVDRQVVADARRLGLLVGSAGEPSLGDFHVPAAWREGGLALAVSTGGAGPALAVALRDRLAASLGPAPVALVGLLEELRPIARRRLPDPALRRRLLTSWADSRWLDLLTTSGEVATRAALLAELDRAAAGHTPD